MSRPPQFVPGGSQVCPITLLPIIIFFTPGTNEHPLQAWLKDPVEVQAECVEPQRVVLHPGGHEQDNHLLINQPDDLRKQMESNQWSLQRKNIVKIYILVLELNRLILCSIICCIDFWAAVQEAGLDASLKFFVFFAQMLCVCVCVCVRACVRVCVCVLPHRGKLPQTI